MLNSFKWLKDENNRGAVLAIVTVIVTIASGYFFLVDRLTIPNRSSEPPTSQTIAKANYTSNQAIGDGVVIVATDEANINVQLADTKVENNNIEKTEQISNLYFNLTNPQTPDEARKLIMETLASQNLPMNEINLSCIAIKGWDISRCVKNGLDLSFASLNEAKINSSDLRDVDFTGADFVDSQMAHSNFKRARFLTADLERAYLVGSNFQDVNFTAAYLGEASMWSTDLNNAVLIDAKLPYADISNSNLHHAFLIRAKLFRVDLHDANLAYAMLLETDLTEANLMNVDFYGANLSGAVFTSSQLDGANFKQAWTWNDMLAIGIPFDISLIECVYDAAIHSRYERPKSC